MLYSALLQHALSWCLLSSCLASEVIDWLRSMGGTAQGLQLADFADMGRGLRCGERVLAESVVLDVPRELFFSGDSGNALALSFGADILLSDSEAIAFQLLVERAKGQLSTWAPYLDVLPRSAVLTPKAFSKSGFEALQDSLFVENNLQSQELTGVSASGVRGSLNLAVRKACGASEVSNIGACIEAHTSSKAWAWALSIIDSRALTFKGARHLIPVADLVNYKPHPHASTRRFASGDFFLQHHKLTPTSIKTLSDRTCELGAQFFEDYGDNPTTIYVEHHGFVPKEVNPFDCVPVSLPALNHDSNEHANRRIDMLKALGVRSMPPSCFKASLDEIDPNLRYFLWVIDMDMEQMEACIASIETSCQQRLAIDARINPSDVGQPSSDCEYAFTPPPHDAPVLVSSLLDVVAKHPLTQTTSMEDDTRTLSNGGLSRDVSLAVQFRRSRKALLSQLVYEAEGALDANSKPNDQSSMPKEVSVAASWNLVLSQNGTLLHPLGLRVQAFNSWAKSMNWPQLHIQAAVLASHGGRVGTIATKTLHKGEIYLEIPESSQL